MDITEYWKEQLDGFEGSLSLWFPVLVALMVTALAVLAGPLIPAPLVAVGSIAVVRILLNNGVIRKPTWVDYLIISFGVLVIIVAYLVAVSYTFTTVSLWRILFAAIVADVLAYFIGFVEWKGYLLGKPVGTIVSVIGSVLIFFISSMIVGGGIAGIVIGGIAALGSMIPGPIPVTTIAVLIIYYLISKLTVWYQELMWWFL